MKRAKKMTADDARLVLWALSKRNEAIEAYRDAQRRYCLCCENWDEVQQARRNAHYYGVTDETLVEVDIEVMNSITEEELLKAVYGE